MPDNISQRIKNKATKEFRNKVQRAFDDGQEFANSCSACLDLEKLWADKEVVNCSTIIPRIIDAICEANKKRVEERAIDDFMKRYEQVDPDRLEEQLEEANDKINDLRRKVAELEGPPNAH